MPTDNGRGEFFAESNFEEVIFRVHIYYIIFNTGGHLPFIIHGINRYTNTTCMSHTKLLWLLPLALLCACSNAYNKGDATAPSASEQNYIATADSVSFADDVSSLTSPSRKVIRTATFRCRVSDVYTSTSKLEALVKANGGIVQESRIQNNTSEQKTINYKPDSLRQVQVYQTTATLTLRVPTASLDSIINAIPQMSAFIEERSLQQEDVTLKYLHNSLNNAPGNDHTHLALKNAKRTNEVLNVAEYEADKNEKTTDRRIENLQMLDNVNYATINITFFQPEQVNTTTIVNASHYTSPAFNIQFFSAINSGWLLLRDLIIGLIAIWPLLLLTISIIWAITRFARRRWNTIGR